MWLEGQPLRPACLGLQLLLPPTAWEIVDKLLNLSELLLPCVWNEKRGLLLGLLAG